jgi:hypothetical protein
VGLDLIPAVTSDSYLRGERTSAFTPRCGVCGCGRTAERSYLSFETVFRSCNVPKSPS